MSSAPACGRINHAIPPPAAGPHLALAQERPAEALLLLERAVAIYDANEGIQIGELECRFRLARALAGTGGDRSRMLAEAHKAADGLRERGASGAERLPAVEAFLAEHEGAPSP